MRLEKLASEVFCPFVIETSIDVIMLSMPQEMQESASSNHSISFTCCANGPGLYSIFAEHLMKTRPMPIDSHYKLPVRIPEGRDIFGCRLHLCGK